VLYCFGLGLIANLTSRSSFAIAARVFTGPTATPIIFTNITIQGQGATLQLAANGPNMRLFAVGDALVTVTPPGGSATTVSGTGSLTLQDAYIRNFHVKGGDGNSGGGGGLAPVARSTSAAVGSPSRTAPSRITAPWAAMEAVWEVPTVEAEASPETVA
jgi:hypothetical protein